MNQGKMGDNMHVLFIKNIIYKSMSLIVPVELRGVEPTFVFYYMSSRRSKCKIIKHHNYKKREPILIVLHLLSCRKLQFAHIS